MKRFLYIPIFVILLFCQLILNFDFMHPFMLSVSAVDFASGLPITLVASFMMHPFDKTVAIVAATAVLGGLFYKYLSSSYAPAVTALICFLITGRIICSVLCVLFCLTAGRISDA